MSSIDSFVSVECEAFGFSMQPHLTTLAQICQKLSLNGVMRNNLNGQMDKKAGRQADCTE